MTKSEKQLQDIRSTGEEAERWLEALESDHLTSHTDAEPNEVVFHQHTTTEPATPSDQAHPALLLLILAILFCPLILLAVYQSVSKRPPTALAYSASCGSTLSHSGRWWPVLGGGERSLLTTVRSRYCGDAFIKATGALQVASFGSLEEAEAFKARIEEATGEPFRVGQGIVPGE